MENLQFNPKKENNEIQENKSEATIRHIAREEVDKRFEELSNEVVTTKVKGQVNIKMNESIVAAEIEGSLAMKMSCRRCGRADQHLSKVGGMGERYYCDDCKEIFKQIDQKAALKGVKFDIT